MRSTRNLDAQHRANSAQSGSDIDERKRTAQLHADAQRDEKAARRAYNLEVRRLNPTADMRARLKRYEDAVEGAAGQFEPRVFSSTHARIHSETESLLDWISEQTGGWRNKSASEMERERPPVEAVPELRVSDVDWVFNQEAAAERAVLYRVEIANETPGTVARNVLVKLDSDLLRDVLPVDIHAMHDNTPPYRRTHEIRYGSPVRFDLIGERVDDVSEEGREDPARTQLYFYRADMPNGVIHRLSSQEMAKVLASLTRHGHWDFTVRVIGEPPLEPIAESFRVTQSDKRGESGGSLFIKKIPVSEPRTSAGQP
jgi:hypothetical protein